MTKLIIQIPCFNEQATLGATLADLPRTIDGVDKIEILIIDDGSSDETIGVARAHGVDHIVRNTENKGLAFSFQRGLDAALAHGADIIVNTDGDNQYCGADVAVLVEPILGGAADMVIGDRQTQKIAHFSPLKKGLQRLGSAFVKRLSGIDAPDAVSGFRAFSADAARALTVRSSFSYTVETLIQAGKKRLTVASVPVRTHYVERPSRLFKSIPHFLARSGQTMLRVYAMYEPLRVFLAFGVLMTVLGALPILRFIYLYLVGDGAGKIQSLIIGGVLLLVGVLSAMFAMIADLIAYNRQLQEITLERVRRLENRLDRQQANDVFPEEKIRKELKALPEMTQDRDTDQNAA